MNSDGSSARRLISKLMKTILSDRVPEAIEKGSRPAAASAVAVRHRPSASRYRPCAEPGRAGIVVVAPCGCEDLQAVVGARQQHDHGPSFSALRPGMASPDRRPDRDRCDTASVAKFNRTSAARRPSMSFDDLLVRKDLDQMPGVARPPHGRQQRRQAVFQPGGFGVSGRQARHIGVYQLLAAAHAPR